ncbi:Uncharacterized protein PBTT_02804 [Plasmodiophora brassicae]
MLTKEQDDELEDIFKTVDGDGTGSIPFDKLADLVKACGSPMSETELRQEIGDSLITFKTFRQIIMHPLRSAVIEDELRQVFDRLSQGGAQPVTASTLSKALSGEDNPPHIAELQLMIDQVDSTGTGAIDYETLKAAFLGRT